MGSNVCTYVVHTYCKWSCLQTSAYAGTTKRKHILMSMYFFDDIYEQATVYAEKTKQKSGKYSIYILLLENI